MAYKSIRKEGETFINQVCINGGSDLLKGKSSSSSLSKETTIVYKGSVISDGKTLAIALINWFNKYANMFDLDANIIAAQAYAESNYVMYANSGAATGVNQFQYLTIYGVVVTNNGKAILENSNTSMTIGEIDVITNGLKNPNIKESYDLKSSDPTDAKYNIPILHQNVVDNPEIMIKAQCYYMKFFADKCDSLASSTLFCYSRGWYMDNTYSKVISKCKADKSDIYLEEGLNYVARIFGILGDKGNSLENRKGFGLNYKLRNHYFGYDELKLMEDFNPYQCNTEESSEFGLNESDFQKDMVVEQLSKNSKYSFIYFPEKDYYSKKYEKKQIVLHHTVSGPGIKNDAQWWESKAERITTSFIIGRDGEIMQLFSTDYWAHHIGIQSSVFNEYNITDVDNELLNQQSIGIEIDSWGGLIKSDGKWYPTKNDVNRQLLIANTDADPISNENVVLYPEGYHGFYGFERYTDAQINAVKDVINAIRTKWDKIPKTYNEDMWDVSKNALLGNAGIWTHVSYRIDKSDCHKQDSLIQMLKSL
jgi:N-acetyl-anhydromuramyl-L-alanine amidase AmpD